MAPLSLGRTLLRRLAGALLAPALLWAPLALLLGLRALEEALIFEAFMWALSVPVALLFAGWLPVAERLSLEGGVLCVRWWSLGEKNHAFPLSGLIRLVVHGRSLRIQRRGLPALTVRLPWGSTELVQQWVAELDPQLAPEPVAPAERGPLPQALDQAMVAHTHEGVRLRLSAVHQPLPTAFAVLGLLAGWAALLPVVLVLLAQPALLFVGLVLLGAGLVGTALATWAQLAQIQWVELALVGPQLKITTQRMRDAEHRTLPLADVHDIEEIDGELYLRTREGRSKLPLPARSRGTVEALRGLLAEHIEQSSHLQGQVAPELDVLLQGRRREARERQRD
jgi:hypothetical protein